MSIQTAEIVPGEVTQANWDTKFEATTKPLANLGGVGVCDADNLPESATKKWAGETGATLDQTGAEIRDSVVALGDDDRKIVITRPISGNKKVYATNVNGTNNKLEIEHSDTPEV